MRLRIAAAGLLAFGLAGCDMNLDLTNPNAPTDKTALGSLDGVIATSLGMQDQFTGSMNTYVRAPSLVGYEWGVTTKTLAADQSLFLGEGVDASFGVVSGPYYATYRIVRTADEIIGAVPTLSDVGSGLAAGLTANAKLFKAMALGMAAMQYASLPLGADVDGATLVPREQVLAEVIRLLESARTDIAGVTDAELAGFKSRALTPSFDLRNTIDAMLARYYLYTNQYDEAIAAAERVDLSVVSLFTYPDPDLNPIYNYSAIAGYTAALTAWAEAAEPGDQRVTFWADTAGAPPAAASYAPIDPFALYGTRNAPIPAYVPGEMLLIQAEAHARQGDLARAVELINEVRTKSGTATTPGAELPPVSALVLDTEAEVLAQIAYERRYEMYSQGTIWEDLRRLGQYIGLEPKLDFLPTPQSECTTNPNAGC